MKVVQIVVELHTYEGSFTPTVRVAANKAVAKRWVEKHINQVLKDYDVNQKIIKLYRWNGDLFEVHSRLNIPSECSPYISLKETTLIE